MIAIQKLAFAFRGIDLPFSKKNAQSFCSKFNWKKYLQ